MSINVNVGNFIPTNVVEVGNEISADQLAAITSANSPSGLNPFSTASHIHTIANVSGLQTTLDGKAGISHTHTISSISDLQTALDGKASNAHTHTIGNITGLPEALSLKADVTHTHTIANVTGLQTALDGKSAISHLHTGVYAPVTHSHGISDVTGLQTALDGKASTASLNGKLDLAGGTMTGGLVFALNDTDARITFNDGSIQSTASYSKAQSDANMTTVAGWVSTKADLVHTHAISDVTGLQTALNSKLTFPQSWIEGIDIGRTFTISDGVLNWDNGGSTITHPVTGPTAGTFTFNKKISCNVVSGVAGINIGVGGTEAASTNAGDIWVNSGSSYLNFRDGSGNWRYCLVNNQANTIDVSTATSPALRVTQRGAGNALIVEDSTTPDTTSFIVNNAGAVGIGVPSGWAPIGAGVILDVNGSVNINGSLTLPASVPFTPHTINGVTATFQFLTVTGGVANIVSDSTNNVICNIASGAIGPSKQKNIEIGCNGLSGSTTMVKIGSAVSGNTSYVTINGNAYFNSGLSLSGQSVNTHTNAFSIYNREMAITINGQTCYIPYRIA